MSNRTPITQGLDLEGAVCLVTGGTRGIGAAVSKGFLQAGCELVVTGTSADSLRSFREILGSEVSRRVRFLQADFSERDSLENLISELTDIPRLDILVNNAGTNINSELDSLRAEDFDHLHQVNLRAPLLLMKAASKRMAEQNWGRIVNIASIWSIVTRAGRVAYTAAKSGLVGATKTAAVDLAEKGILVNAVSPGFTLTELTSRTLSSADIDELSEKIPVGRFATPDEIVGIVVFLCSRWNTYITGQNIAVDGGFTLV